MIVPGPTRVRPSTTTWEWSRTPSASSTSGPTTQNGPMATPEPILAAGSITALGWIAVVMVGDSSLIQDHRCKGRLGTQRAVDLRLATELPDIAPVLKLGDVDVHLIARHDRLAEARIIDR